MTDRPSQRRFITVASMTAIIAGVAGAGAALVFYHGSAGPRPDCGLVTCAVALPGPVRTSAAAPASGDGTGGGDSTARPAATAAPAPTTVDPATAQPVTAPSPTASSPPASSPPASSPPASSPAAVSSPSTAPPTTAPSPTASPAASSSPATAPGTAGQAFSADPSISVHYAITQDSYYLIHGQIVMANNGWTPVTGWRVTVVLPGDSDYQVLGAANRSAGDALVMTAPAAGQAIAPGSTDVITFTARGTTSTPVRSTFTDCGRPRPGAAQAHAGAPGPDAGDVTGEAGSGPPRYEGWPGGWLGGWLTSGWPNGPWPGRGGAGHGWSGGGRPGRHQRR